MNIELSGHYGHRRIVRSVLPSIGMVLVTSIYSIVDGFFVSNFAGKTGFAAVNLTFPAIMMIGSLGLMIGTGGAALVGIDGIWLSWGIAEVLSLILSVFLVVRFAPHLIKRC